MNSHSTKDDFSSFFSSDLAASSSVLAAGSSVFCFLRHTECLWIVYGGGSTVLSTVTEIPRLQTPISRLQASEMRFRPKQVPDMNFENTLNWRFRARGFLTKTTSESQIESKSRNCSKRIQNGAYLWALGETFHHSFVHHEIHSGNLRKFGESTQAVPESRQKRSN